MKIKQNGVYILKDSFFEKYKDPNLSVNKSQKRPYFYVLYHYHLKKNNKQVLKEIIINTFVRQYH